MKQWGFDASEDLKYELFEWCDRDADGRISYEDLRSSVGHEIAPMEQFYFRQDIKPSKAITCAYDKCWENNDSNSKS